MRVGCPSAWNRSALNRRSATGMAISGEEDCKVRCGIDLVIAKIRNYLTIIGPEILSVNNMRRLNWCGGSTNPSTSTMRGGFLDRLIGHIQDRSRHRPPQP